jgi:hypothetical protein
VGNSTISVQDIIDRVAVAGDTSPQANPGAYGAKVCLALANNTMSDLLSERFNWKWNSKNAQPFYTNSFQQDYPQVGLTDVEWLEMFQWIDINNTALPKPISRASDTQVVRDLPRQSLWAAQCGWPTQLCWMYNKDLSYGVWPGANVTYGALITAAGQVSQNPPMAILDANGNILVLTTPNPASTWVTGSTAPVLAANSAEGMTVADGSCVWTVAGPLSQGWRVWPLPGATGPVYQMQVKYQTIPTRFTALNNLLSPIPDNYSQYFERGFEAYCMSKSPDPNVRARFDKALDLWLSNMAQAAKQGDKEQSAYGLVPGSFPMDWAYPGGLRNPKNPATPY